MTLIRPAAVAGQFYPADRAELRAEIGRRLAAVEATSGACPKLIVVPHAGYVYSGAVAALAYAPLARWKGRITRVVLLGPTHRVAVQGLAAPTADAFETPLGRVALDRAALSALEACRQIVWSDAAHAYEHSLEVQLPFLQTVLGDGFTLVPLAVGQATPAEVADVVERLWGGDETLIVVSTDLSHALPDAVARVRDRETVQRILGFATDLRGDEACGAAPLNGALTVARRHGLAPHVLGLRNSGEVPQGERGRVVGYGAIAFDEPALAPRADEAALGRALLRIARGAIGAALGCAGEAAAPAEEPPGLHRPGASFVTLRDRDGHLRGCIGRLEATRALGDDVRSNALAAAFADPRFAPLKPAEWPAIRIEISVLGRPEPLEARSRAEALAALRPGIDGVILEWRGARATLLPQVWEQCPAPAQFMAALARKANLPADFWADDLKLWRYCVRAFDEVESAAEEPA